MSLYNSPCSFATEGSYAIDPDGSSRILEYRCEPPCKIVAEVHDVCVLNNNRLACCVVKSACGR